MRTARFDTLAIPLSAHLAFADRVRLTGALSVQEPIISLIFECVLFTYRFRGDCAVSHVTLLMQVPSKFIPLFIPSFLPVLQT